MPDGRPYAYSLGMLQDQFELRVFLDHRDDVAADLLGQHHQFDVFVVFEAVADDRRLIVGDSHDGEQFRLRSGFQSETIGPAELEYFFDYLSLLVHFDRVNAAYSRPCTRAR